jgi:hypothetical protein
MLQPVQTFQPFNRSAPFNALRWFKVQEFKETLAVQAVQPLRSVQNVSG